jgi:hypothetical protein
MSTALTLTDLWRGRVAAANLAGQLLTQRTGRNDSVFAGDTYGSAFVDLVERSADGALIRAEVERVLGVVESDGVIEEYSDSGVIVRTIDARIAIAGDGASEAV